MQTKKLWSVFCEGCFWAMDGDCIGNCPYAPKHARSMDNDFIYSMAVLYKSCYKRLLFRSMAAIERVLEKELGQETTHVVIELLKSEVERGVE